MKYAQIRPDLFLVQQDVSTQLKSKSDSKTPVDGPLSHIWIYDRSGSMYNLLHDLVDDLISKVKSDVEIGDTLSVGWFSSEGDFDFIVKGFTISDDKSRQQLVDMLKRNNTTRGCTCFSEILHRTADVVIKDLAAINPSFALCFFTDGYPVVNNYQTEVQSLWKALDKIQGQVASSLLVGYGHYYNKELMSQMAERLGGSLVHSSGIAEFSTSLSDLIKDASETGAKQEVTLDFKPLDGLAFTVTGRRISILSGVDGCKAIYAPSRREKSQFVYYLAKNIDVQHDDYASFDLEKVDPNAKAESIARGAYAAALLLTQRTKTDVAIDILGKLGDVALVDAITNSFTNSEYGVAEGQIKAAVIKPAQRFLRGKKLGYVPPEDAFCLLDALSILIEDDEAMFYPGMMDYKRIGRKANTVGEIADFEWEEGVASPISDLTWNDKYLNLSVRAFIRGTVELGKGYKKLGLQKKFPTHIYRNYALVKDGHVNIPEFPVTLSQDSMLNNLLFHECI